MEWILFVLIKFCALPLFLLLSIVIILAIFGKSVGVRHVYIKLLIFLFNWGTQTIKERTSHPDENDDSEDASQSSTADGGDPKSSNAFNQIARQRSVVELEEGFQLSDAMFFARDGIQAIVEDEVTQRFNAAELSSWNLLTRTNTNYEYISTRLTVLWFLGCILRYCFLLPFRAVLAFIAIGLILIGTFLIGYLPEGSFKKWCHARLALTSYRIMNRAFSAMVTYHNKENRAIGGGICVANHTSPIDIIILGADNCYAMVGQAHGGFIGFMQRAFSKAESHIWFQREESTDRAKVAQLLKKHISDDNKLPILIFPEGTCINNSSVMMFKKGSFEIGGTVYPVAIKYDPHFADAFWNSSKHSMVQHLLMILTSWALVVDVWYLPPTRQMENESAIDFANRVKHVIAEQGGLFDLDWDGGLKRSKPKPQMMAKRQANYVNSKGLKNE